MEYRKEGKEWTGKGGSLKGLRRKAGREGEEDTRKKSVGEDQTWVQKLHSEVLLWSSKDYKIT